jgi:hypothetical protein
MKLDKPIPGEAIQGGQAHENRAYWYSGRATHIVPAGESMHILIKEHGFKIARHTTDIAVHDRYFVVRNESGQKGVLYATPLTRNWKPRGQTDGFAERSAVLKEARSRKITPPRIIVPSGPNGLVKRKLRAGRAACASGFC